jgi:glycosyltransferase involved in cell wall biosynthesis
MSESSALVDLSVLIPNYNYAQYIGETITSVLAQGSNSIEILVCDNASTDHSVSVVERLGDARVKMSINPCNVGFAANLERVASFATGRRMLLLSSDDRMAPGALAAFTTLAREIGPASDRAVWGSEVTIIDGSGNRTGEAKPDPKLWRDAKAEPSLTQALGHPVRSMPAATLLRRSLELLRSPLPFATTCYPRALHDLVGGYSGGRMINPDKWFLWKLLSVAETAYSIDAPLFDYRVHGAGQASLEQRSGALKHLTDQYVATFNLPESVIAAAKIDRDTLARAFIEQDIALRGLVSIAEGRRVAARRTVQFGLAAYPEVARRNPKVWALRALVRLGPIGTSLARALRRQMEKRWQESQSRSAREP